MSKKIEEIVRVEIERCDLFSGFIMCSSPNGGAGSGLTSKTLNQINDQCYSIE